MTNREGPAQFSVELTADALEDIRSIRDYINTHLNAQRAATRTIEAIFDAAESLSTLPYRNRSLSPIGSSAEIRSTRAGNYRLLYLITEKTVRIFAVLYGKQNIEGRLSALLERVQ